MNRPAKPSGGQCPHDAERDACPLTCKYNHFESDDLVIHAWELKCLDCGWRETLGWRSDESDDDLPADFNPAQCPFCQKCELKPGKNPCGT